MFFNIKFKKENIKIGEEAIWVLGQNFYTNLKILKISQNKITTEYLDKSFKNKDKFYFDTKTGNFIKSNNKKFSKESFNTYLLPKTLEVKYYIQKLDFLQSIQLCWLNSVKYEIDKTILTKGLLWNGHYFCINFDTINTIEDINRISQFIEELLISQFEK